MAKRYLSKEEKQNYKLWVKEAKEGTLLTSSSIAEICKKYNNNPQKIGKYILDLAGKADETVFEFDEADEILFVE